MPKMMKVKLSDRLEYRYFYEAYLRARERKANKLEILKVDLDLENYLYSILTRIKNNTFHFGKYREFVIYEPKMRVIKALPYKDRIVHQWYIEEFIKPYYLPRFIKDSYACIPGGGTHKAVEQLQKYMRIMKRKYGRYYCLKCDVHKFFYSIHLDILYDILKRSIKDPDVLTFTKKLLYQGAESDIGIPIGNYTSQYFANIYMNELDQYIKHQCHIKYYLRYMDDFILLLSTKEEAKEMYQKIEHFLKEHLALTLNPKTKYFPNTLGVDFCGYIVRETHTLLRKRSVVKIKRKVAFWNKLYAQNKLDIKRTQLCFNSFMAHASHASARGLRHKVYLSMAFSDQIKEEIPCWDKKQDNCRDEK